MGEITTLPELGSKVKLTQQYFDDLESQGKDSDSLSTRKFYTVIAQELPSSFLIDSGQELQELRVWKNEHFTVVPSKTTVTESVEATLKEVTSEAEETVEAATEPEEVAEPEVKPATIAHYEVIGQDENKEVIKLAIEHDLPVLLIGETGTGKTSLVREQAINQGKTLTRFSITGETTVDEFVGKYELEAGATVWKDGVLLDAMKNGKWLVADEINVALPEILFVLHSLLDDDKQITVSNHLGEVVKPHEDFRFFATMNPPEEYAGTKELNKAFQSRFSVVLQVHYPEPEIEAKILADKTAIELSHATKMVDVANALRQAKKDDKIFYTCSTRDLLHWSNLVSKGMHPNDAFRVAVLNKTGQDAEAITKIYQGIIGDYIKLETPGVTLTIEWFKAQKAALESDMQSFESRKQEIREEITADIVKQLTGAGTQVTASPKPEELTDGVFSS